MKKSINIGVIVFLLLHACSSSENTENQTIVEPISEDTPINEPSEPNNPPPPPENNNPPPPPENKKPPVLDFDGKKYDINSLPDEVKDILKGLQVADTQIRMHKDTLRLLELGKNSLGNQLVVGLQVKI